MAVMVCYVMVCHVLAYLGWYGAAGREGSVEERLGKVCLVEAGVVCLVALRLGKAGFGRIVEVS